MDLRDLDMDAIADRYELTFAGKNEDRPIYHISYGLGKTVEMPPAPDDLREKWFDFDWRIECFERGLENAGFMCEGFPATWCNLGPDILAACTGSELIFEPGTSWAKFRVDDWSAEPALEFQRDGFYWQSTERFLKLTAERGNGRWLIGSGDLHTNGDGLSALRGPENLLLDLYDCPDEIHKRLAECHRVWEQMIDAHFEIIHPGCNGMNSSWCSATCHGRYGVIQNDFCCMVGPEMFDTFFKEYIEKEAAYLDCSIYHLDGPDAMKHLDSICASESLDIIQWVPGAGSKPMNEWPDFLRHVQEFGKGLWLYGSPQEQLDIMTQVDPKGCMYNVGFPDREAAEAWLKEAEAILKKKRITSIPIA